MIDKREILIEMKVKRDGKEIIVEGEKDMGNIRGKGSRDFLSLIGWIGRFKILSRDKKYIIKEK